MTNRGFLFSGFCFSLFFHAAAFLVVAPNVAVPDVVGIKGQSVFLGAILGDADVTPPETHGAALPARSFGLKERPQARGHLAKVRFSAQKPVFPLPPGEWIRPSAEISRLPPGPAPLQDTITFGFSDVSLYFLNCDLSDIEKMARRSETSGVVEFEAVVSGSGDVRSLRKIEGSGDPMLDSYLSLKLNRAVMNPPWAKDGARYRLRLELRQGKVPADHVPN